MARTSLHVLRGQVQAGPPFAEALIAELARDERSGAKALYAACLRKLARAEALARHREAMSRYEREAAAEGFRRVAGVDEAGRGPLAGPIVAAAVVLGANPPCGLNDSKQLSEERREALFAALHAGGHAIGVAVVSAARIDRVGIQAANYAAMCEAAQALAPPPDYLLVDGFRLPNAPAPHRRIVKGDALSLSIAAASIVAKVTRDRIMVELDARHPGYGFARHKGYGTVEHLAALALLGPCEAHRASFAPLASRAQNTELFLDGERNV